MSALRQFTSEKVKSGNQLYKPNEVIRWRRMPSAGSSGTRRYVGENPGTDAQLFYSLSRDVQSAELEIRDITGRRVALLAGGNRTGLQKVIWDMRITAGTTPPAAPAAGGRGVSVAAVVDSAEVALAAGCIKFAGNRWHSGCDGIAEDQRRSRVHWPRYGNSQRTRVRRNAARRRGD